MNPHHRLTSKRLMFFSVCEQANISQNLHKTVKTILSPHPDPTPTPIHHETNTPEHQEDLTVFLEIVLSTFCVPGTVLGTETSAESSTCKAPAWACSNSCSAAELGGQICKTDGFCQCGKGCAGVPGSGG